MNFSILLLYIKFDSSVFKIKCDDAGAQHWFLNILFKIRFLTSLNILVFLIKIYFIQEKATELIF